MKILCFVDELGSGGAQRQLVTMAKGFQKRGHELQFLIYHPGGHFLPELQEANIATDCMPDSGHLQRFIKIRRFLRRGKQEVVLAFLEAPSLYAELAGLPNRNWALVVGERSGHPETGKGPRRWLRWPHRFADAVVANSHSTRLMLQRAWPGLRQKLHTVYNGLDLQRFKPAQFRGENPVPTASLKVLVVASYQRLKNMLGLAKALELLRRTGQVEVVVDWYGAVPPDAGPFREANTFIRERGLTSAFHFHPPIREIEKEYQRADVVGLFSEYEGLPNVICEGMACGKPVILSDVCDARFLVEESKNGFLCDPRSPESIAGALRKMAALNADGRQRMGRESRKRAEQLFDPQKCLWHYERIMESAIAAVVAKLQRGTQAGVPASSVFSQVRNPMSRSVTEVQNK